MEPLTTLYTQNRVNLYSWAADTTWDNFAFRQAILCDAATDHHIGFLKANIQTLALKILLPI